MNENREITKAGAYLGGDVCEQRPGSTGQSLI